MALTIKDIAKETGYAISTVSRVLNNRPDVSAKARDTIMAAVQARRFVANNNAKQLKQRATRAIGLVVKGRSNLLFAAIVEEMQTQIEAAGYAAQISYLDEDANEVEHALRLAAEAKPLGLVFLGGSRTHFQQSFAAVQLPSVLVTNSAAGLGFTNLSSVTTDDTAGAALAVEYLVAQGHTNIGVLGGDTSISHTSYLRYKGCLQALKEHDLAFLEERQFQTARFSYQSAYKNMQKLWQKCPKITAVFTMGDVMSIGAVRALLDAGLKVPEDVSVIGFDGIELAAYYNPKLATVCQNSVQLAARGIQSILESIHNKGAATHETVPCTLVEGQSVRCL